MKLLHHFYSTIGVRPSAVLSAVMLIAGCVQSRALPPCFTDMHGDVGVLHAPEGVDLDLWKDMDKVFVGCRQPTLRSAIEGTGVTRVRIPRAVGNIEIAGISRYGLAFSDTLEEVFVEDGVAMDVATFYYDVKLKTVRLPHDLREIPDSLFSNCVALEFIEIPSGVAKIGDGAFYGTAISEVVIPDAVTSIGSEAFGCCRRLKVVSLPFNARVDSDAFDGCDMSKFLVIRRGSGPGSGTPSDTRLE